MFITINGIKVPIISIDDLITMKQVSMRDQDISDIEYLKRTKDER